MYIKDGIVYGEDTSKPIKIDSVKVLPDRMMIVTFSSGESRLFDTTTLSGPAFRPLEDPEVFNNPVIDHGVITWMDGEIDIAPESVYRKSYSYSKEVAGYQ